MRSVFLVFGLFVATTLTASAQFGGSSGLSVVPPLPQPGEDIVVSVDLSLQGDENTTIQWFRDGVRQPALNDQREFRSTAPNLGEQESYRVVVVNQQGVTLIDQSAVIRPLRVDVVLEPQTIAPPQYQGAAIASRGALVRAVALPQTLNGGPVSQYSYKWRKDGRPLNEGARQNRNDITFRVSGAGEYITVEVYDDSGAMVGRESVAVPFTAPEVHFYVDNPLRGLSAYTTGNRYTLNDSQLTIEATPFYFPALDQNIETELEWSIDGNTVSTGGRNPFRLEVARANNARGATIGFAATTIDDRFFPQARGSFRVDF